MSVDEAKLEGERNDRSKEESNFQSIAHGVFLKMFVFFSVCYTVKS